VVLRTIFTLTGSVHGLGPWDFFPICTGDCKLFLEIFIKISIKIVAGEFA
jgi:hypothetical protein